MGTTATVELRRGQPVVEEFLDEWRGLKAASSFERFRDDPVGFARGPLHEFLWDKLEEVLRSVWENQRTAVQSCANVGKTFIGASAAIAWLNVYRDSCKVITTAAPPERQIKELLWGEIRSKYARARARGINLVGGEPGIMTLRVSDSWWAQGFTIPTSGTREERIARFHGHHAEHVLIIVDECHGVPPEVIEACMDMLSGFHCHLLLLANPLAPSGPFYNAATSGKFNVIQISAFDHPNVIDDRPIVPGAVSRQAVEDAIASDVMTRSLFEGEKPDGECFQVPWDGAYCPELKRGQWRRVISPAFSYRFLGRFPSQAKNAVCSLALIQAAMQRWKERAAEVGAVPPEGVRPKAGQDVAEFGDDSNVLTLRYRNWVAPQSQWTGMDPIETAKRAARELAGKDPETVNVDATGVGAGAAPDLKKNHGLPAHSVKVAESPTAKVEEGEFFQLRDQLAWAVREWLRTETDAMLPPDDGLLAELSATTYDFNLKNQIRVSMKKELKKLLGRSPDKKDSLELTFAPISAPAAMGDEDFSQAASSLRPRARMWH